MRKTIHFFIPLIIMAAAIMASPASLAQQKYTSSCWVLEDLQGIGIYQDDAYRPMHASMGRSIILNIDGDNSSTEASDMTTFQVDDFMVVSYSNGDTITTFEVYQVDPTAGIATYTKSMNVKGYLGGLSGATAFVGRATRCP